VIFQWKNRSGIKIGGEMSFKEYLISLKIGKVVRILKVALILFLGAGVYNSTATADELDELCKKQLCRKPITISLYKKDGTQFNMTLPRALPIVSGAFLTIYPGEEIFVEAEMLDEGLGGLKAVQNNSRPEKTLVFKFEQAAGKPDMYLKIQNPFNKTIKFHAVMMSTKSDKMYKTSSCPVPAKLIGYEHWPHEIFQLMMFEFKFLAEGATMECEF